MKENMVIVNADDYGLTELKTMAIAEAFSKELISNTTMVGNAEEKLFYKAVDLAGKKRFADKIGVHLNVTEGIPVTKEILGFEEFCQEGSFHGNKKCFLVLGADAKHVLKKELEAQIDRIRSAGIMINHIDSHHHIHTSPAVIGIVKQIALEKGINRIRLYRNVGHISPYKMLVKNIYNKSLRRQFAVTDFFGGYSDYTDKLMQGCIEVMVHPEFDEKGVLIDRQGRYESVPLENIKKITNKRKTVSYNAI